MNWFVTLIIRLVFIAIIIVLGHSLYDYIKFNNSKTISKNMYTTQIDKYKDIVEEIQNEYLKEQDTLKMQKDIESYLEDAIKE